MTAWTTPTTWSSGNIPTAAQLNTQIRDNMLHLKEGTNAFGYAYASDPRLYLSGTYFGAGVSATVYVRGSGRCPVVRAIRMRITASAGQIDAGIYSNAGTGMSATPAAAAIPDALKDSAGDTVCPAVGTADVLMALGTTEFEPRDWFAIGLGTGGGTQAIYASGNGSGYLGGGRGWYNTSGYLLSTTAEPLFGLYVAFAVLAIP